MSAEWEVLVSMQHGLHSINHMYKILAKIHL